MSQRHVRVGDLVHVYIARADMIHFGYQITPSESTPLAITYGVIGVGRLAESGTLGGEDGSGEAHALTNAITAPRDEPVTLDALVGSLRVLSDEAARLVVAAKALTGPVQALDADFDAATWGAEGDTAATWPARYDPTRKVYQRQRSPVGLRMSTIA